MALTRFVRTFGYLGVVSLIGSPLWLACQNRGSDSQARAEQAGREAGAAARDAARSARDAAHEAGRNVEAWLRGFREETGKLDESRKQLDARARKLQGDARADADRRIAELDQRQRELSRDVEELKNAAAGKVDALKSKINDDLEKLKRAYEAAEREIKR
jgi:membrane-bound lytic murein transglycosylase B